MALGPLSALSDGPRAAFRSVQWPYSRSPLCPMALGPLSTLSNGPRAALSDGPTAALSDGPTAALRSVGWPYTRSVEGVSPRVNIDSIP
ncbi:hypothetical protein ACOMHN_041105 [Nucella lapillus]